MRFRRKTSFLTLLNNFKLSFVRALVRVSQSLESKNTLSRKLMKHLDPTLAKQKSLEVMISKKISELEDKGIITIKNNMIYPGRRTAENDVDILETSVVRSLRSLNAVGFDEKIIVFN